MLEFLCASQISSLANAPTGRRNDRRCQTREKSCQATQARPALSQLRIRDGQHASIRQTSYASSCGPAQPGFSDCGRSSQGESETAAVMNIFKTLTLKWWQTGIFKIGLLALGIAIGTYLHDVFGGYLVLLIIVAALSLAYTTYVWWRQ